MSTRNERTVARQQRHTKLNFMQPIYGNFMTMQFPDPTICEFLPNTTWKLTMHKLFILELTDFESTVLYLTN